MDKFRDGPVIDDVCGFGYAGDEVAGDVGGDEDGGGVEEDDVAAGAAFAGEDCSEDGGVGVGIAATEGFHGGAGEADILGGEGGDGDDAVVDFGQLAGSADGDLVQASIGAGVVRVAHAGVAVDDEGVAGVEEGHGFGYERYEMRAVDAHDLCGCSGGIGEGAEDVEDGADAEGSADRHDGLHAGVETGGV